MDIFFITLFVNEKFTTKLANIYVIPNPFLYSTYLRVIINSRAVRGTNAQNHIHTLKQEEDAMFIPNNL